jgi:hypothetical protein
MASRTRWFLIVGSICLLTGGALTQAGAPGDSTSARLAELSAIYDQQQRELDQLNQQVAALQSSQVDAGRAEVMRQQIREVLSEREFRESLMPATTTAGYDNGFFIRSTDDKFLMKIQFYTQFRYTYYQSQPENRYLLTGLRRSDRSGFDFARTRFRIGGHAYDKDLTYFLSMTLAENTAYDARSLYAFVNYRFCDAFQLMVGQMRLMGSRAQTRNISTYQFVELPVSDAVFGAGVGVGARLWGHLFDKRVTYWLDIVNSWNGMGRTITNDPPQLDGNPGVLFRTVWHALSEDPDNAGKDFVYQADLGFHETPALDLGFQYSFNQDNGDAATSRIPFTIVRPRPGQGAFGLTSTTGMQVNQFGLEGAFKYRGFSAVSEFHVRILDPTRASEAPFTPFYQLTGESSTTAYYGGYLQVGYMLPIPGHEDKFEVVGRLEGIGGVKPAGEGTWVYAGGLNYYINPRVKLQTDLTKITEVPISSSTYSLANVNDNALIWRVQLTVAF